MTSTTRKQLRVLGVLVGVYALLALLAYAVIPLEQLVPAGQPIPASTSPLPRWQFAALAAAAIIVVYGLLGLAGYWFARRLALPGIFREGAGWRAWVLSPMLLGLVMGVVLVVLDQVIAAAGATKGFPHPAFPFSVLASATAGISEEIVFRGFVMGVWGFLLNLILRRWNGRGTALWIGNGLAALAFGLSHVPAAMILLDVQSPAALPASAWVELLLLNGLIGLVAGKRCMRDGLVSAMGIHFWADVVWHVLWPLTRLGA